DAVHQWGFGRRYLHGFPDAAARHCGGQFQHGQGPGRAARMGRSGPEVRPGASLPTVGENQSVAELLVQIWRGWPKWVPATKTPRSEHVQTGLGVLFFWAFLMKSVVSSRLSAAVVQSRRLSAKVIASCNRAVSHVSFATARQSPCSME